VNTKPDVSEHGDVEQKTEEHDVPTEDVKDDVEAEEETEVDNGNLQSVPVMQLRDPKRINQPSRYDDYVLTADAMFSSCEPESFEEAVHSDQRNECKSAMKNEIQSIFER